MPVVPDCALPLQSENALRPMRPDGAEAFAEAASGGDVLARGVHAGMNETALILGALAAVYLAYKIGQHRAYRDAIVVVRMVADGTAIVNEDGTVRMAEEDFLEDQRAVAEMQ
jgi:hypothetical protein